MKHAILFLFFLRISVCVKAQIIIGKVLDARTHEPLPYASVSIKNTSIGTLTREDGSFEIKVTNKDIELIFSSIGYFPKVLKSKNTKEVYLDEKDNSLNEVVVFSINPANRIIESAVRNKPFNDPEQLPSFQYEVYHKSIV